MAPSEFRSDVLEKLRIQIGEDDPNCQGYRLVLSLHEHRHDIRSQFSRIQPWSVHARADSPMEPRRISLAKTNIGCPAATILSQCSLKKKLLDYLSFMVADVSSADPLRRQGEVTRLLNEIKRGNSGVADKLVPLIYDDLRRLARRQLRAERNEHTLQTTALVHEAYLKFVAGT